MTSNEQQLAALDAAIKNAQATAELGDALANLRLNPDFKKLVLEGYLKHEAVRLVHAKADQTMASPDMQAKIVRDIDAIGSLHEFFRVISITSAQAKESIAEVEAAREEILAEEAE